MKKVVKHELFEVVITPGTTLTRFPIPDLPNLRNVQVWGVQMYYSDIVPFSVISQRPLIDKAQYKNSFLTLVNYSGNEFLKQAPVDMFQTIENGLSAVAIPGSPTVPSSIQEKDFKNFTGQKVNYPKSFIEVSQPVPVVAFEQVFLVSIYYTDPKELLNNPSQTSFRNKR